MECLHSSSSILEAFAPKEVVKAINELSSAAECLLYDLQLDAVKHLKDVFARCLEWVTNEIAAPCYNFLKTDLGKAELIREYLEENALKLNSMGQELVSIENARSEHSITKRVSTLDAVYKEKELPVRADVVAVLDNMIGRLNAVANLPREESQLLKEIRQIKDIIDKNKNINISLEEFAQLRLLFQSLHLTDSVQQSKVNYEIELLYRETTRASFELQKHAAKSVMIEALTAEMKLGANKTSKNKVSSGFSWSGILIEAGVTLEAEKSVTRTNDDEGYPAEFVEKSASVVGKAEIDLLVASANIEGRVKGSYGKYKEGNTIAHFVDKNFSKLMQEAEFRNHPLIVACSSSVNVLNSAMGHSDNFYIRATTKNELTELNDNKDKTGDYKISHLAWKKHLVYTNSIDVQQPVEAQKPVERQATIPVYGFSGKKTTVAGSIQGEVKLGNAAFGSFDFTGGGKIEKSVITAQSMKTDYCSFLTHPYIRKEHRDALKQELADAKKHLIDDKNKVLREDLVSAWNAQTTAEGKFNLLKQEFDNYSTLHHDFSFYKNKQAEKNEELIDFGRKYGVRIVENPDQARLAACIVRRMNTLNAYLLTQTENDELIQEIKDFQKQLLDTPFLVDKKFMKKHCYKHRKLTLDWTKYIGNLGATATTAFGVAAIGVEGKWEYYDKNHNNPLRTGSYLDVYKTLTGKGSTDIERVTSGSLKHAGQLTDALKGNLAMGVLIVQKKRSDTTLARHFLLRGIQLKKGEIRGPKLLERHLVTRTSTIGAKGSGHVGGGFKVSGSVEHSEEITTPDMRPDDKHYDEYTGESFIQYAILEFNDYDGGRIDKNEVKEGVTHCHRHTIAQHQRAGLHELFSNCKVQLRDSAEPGFLFREMEVFKTYVDKSEQSEESKTQFYTALTNFMNALEDYDDQADLATIAGTETYKRFYEFLGALQPHSKEEKLNSFCYEPIPIIPFEQDPIHVPVIQQHDEVVDDELALLLPQESLSQQPSPKGDVA